MSEQIEKLDSAIEKRVEKMRKIDERLNRQSGHIANVVISRDKNVDHIARLEIHIDKTQVRINELKERIERQNAHLRRNIDSSDRVFQERLKLSDLNARDMIARDMLVATTFEEPKYSPVPAEEAVKVE